MNVNIALLAGDGIGPEIIAQAVKALDHVARKYAHNFTYREALVGACAIDATGDPYPEETHKICREADAVLFGAIGDPKYDNDPKAPVRPEQGLLRMRKSLGLFANLRPIALFDTRASRSPLKAEVVRGTDFICVRELTSGIYFGRPQGRNEAGTEAFDTCTYRRCYLSASVSAGVNLRMECNATGITDSRTDVALPDDTCYDLLGRRVEHLVPGRVYLSARRGVFLQSK